MTSPTRYLPPTGRRLWHYVLGFGVGFGVGIAPFLGKVKVPGFSALLEIYPVQMQKDLIPLSAFLLGTVAVAVQFYSARLWSAANLQRYFGLLFVSLLVAFLILVILYKSFVVLVPFEEAGAGGSVHVLIGWSRSGNCCPADVGDIECIRDLSIDPGMIDQCWKNVRLIELALTIPYLFLMSGFVALVGLLLFKPPGQEGREPAPARPAAKSKAKPRPGARGRGKSPPPAGPADRRP